MFRTMSLVLTSIFVGVGIFSFSKTIDLSQQNTKLTTEIERTLKPRLAHLEQEAVRLRTENVQVREDKAILEEELVKTQSNLQASNEKNEALRQKLSISQTKLKQSEETAQEKARALGQLVQKYKDLLSDYDLVKEKFDAMFLELVEMRKKYGPHRSSYDARLEASQIAEKKNKKSQPSQSTIDKNSVENTESAPAPEANQNEEGADAGNEGFLVREGKSTYTTPKARIRVLNVEE